MPDYSFSSQFDPVSKTFQHDKGHRHDKGFFDVLGLAGRFMTREADPAETQGFPVMSAADNAAPGKADDAVTWIGHATLLFEHAGKTVLTDPMFSERASPVSFSGPKRVVPPARQLGGLPDIDLVVISHAHYDHLDMPTLRQLAALQPDITVIAPLGVGRYVREAGFTDVRELDWWQAAELPGMTVTATPSRHWSSRSFFDRNKTLWAGFMIRFADDFQFYFAGDTGYSTDFEETRNRLGEADLAAIPIGAYKPRDFMVESHCTPEEAVQIFRDLGARRAVAIHWGTFKLTLEPLAEPPVRLDQAMRDAGLDTADFRALTHGERWVFCYLPHAGHLIAVVRQGVAFYLALRVPVSLAFGGWLNYSGLGFPNRNGEPGA